MPCGVSLLIVQRYTTFYNTQAFCELFFKLFFTANKLTALTPDFCLKNMGKVRFNLFRGNTLRLVLHHSGGQFVFYTGLSVDASDWNPKKQEVRKGLLHGGDLSLHKAAQFFAGDLQKVGHCFSI